MMRALCFSICLLVLAASGCNAPGESRSVENPDYAEAEIERSGEVVRIDFPAGMRAGQADPAAFDVCPRGVEAASPIGAGLQGAIDGVVVWCRP
jgi:hypothetical protein